MRASLTTQVTICLIRRYSKGLGIPRNELYALHNIVGTNLQPIIRHYFKRHWWCHFLLKNEMLFFLFCIATLYFCLLHHLLCMPRLFLGIWFLVVQKETLQLRLLCRLIAFPILNTTWSNICRHNEGRYCNQGCFSIWSRSALLIQ